METLWVLLAVWLAWCVVIEVILVTPVFSGRFVHKCDGVRVYEMHKPFDDGKLACACNVLFLWHMVYLSPTIPEGMRHFVLAHEIGHIKMGHCLVRKLASYTGIAFLPFMRSVFMRHEVVADQYALRALGRTADVHYV